MNTRQRRFFLLVLIVLSITAVTILFFTQPAQAAVNCSDSSWVVGNETDLNDAITCYNAKTTAGNYTITFSQNISLTASTTPFSNPISSMALNGANFIIDGQDIDGVRPFTIITDTKVTILNTTIIRGNVKGNGGGILNNGSLSVSNSTLNDNWSYEGGSIFSSGELSVSHSNFNGNYADNQGGGIYSYNSPLTISSCIFNDNWSYEGGGIYSYNGSLTVNDSTFNGNSAFAGGGIVSNDNLSISKSTFYDNSAFWGGGIFKSGTLPATISNSTISGNSADESGGGIFNSNGTLTINNSTISDNSATTNGGGVYNYKILTISNSIIANSNGGDCFNDSGTITDNGHNIVEDNSCGFTGGSDPMLGPLQDNGGISFTHTLLPGSPALDTGNTTLTTDQRHIYRPQGTDDDIGAYEAVQHLLTINKNGSGIGSVTSNPAGIDCGATCTSNFLKNTVITLTATADTNVEFIGWSGGGCSGTDSCVVTLNVASTITATFNSSYKIYLPTIIN